MTHAEFSDLYSELKRYQERLGTPCEDPEDFERITEIAHQINNLRAATYLQRATMVARRAAGVSPPAVDLA